MFDLPPADPGIEITVASRGTAKNIAQTNGPQLVVRGGVRMGEFQLAGQWKNVSSQVADGTANMFLTWQHRIGPVQTRLGLTYKFQTGVEEPTDDRAIELNALVSRKWGRFGGRLSAVLSPDDFGETGRVVFVDSEASYDISKTMRASATLGRVVRHHRPEYTSFTVGISKSFGKFTGEVRYMDNDRADISEFYHARIVVLGRVSL